MVTTDNPNLRSLNWQGLQASEVWQAYILPLLSQLESDLLEDMEVAQPHEQNGLAGQLRMIGKIRKAPEAFIELKQALAIKEQEAINRKEENNARRQLFEKFGTAASRFRRSLK